MGSKEMAQREIETMAEWPRTSLSHGLGRSRGRHTTPLVTRISGVCYARTKRHGEQTKKLFKNVQTMKRDRATLAERKKETNDKMDIDTTLWHKQKSETNERLDPLHIL